MRKIVAFVFLSLVGFEVHSQSLSATSILQSSEGKVKLLEQEADKLSGTLKATVNVTSDIFGKKSEAASNYRVTIKDGKDVKNEIVGTPLASDSTFAKMMGREASRRLNKPTLRIFDSAFPWNMPLSLADRKTKFSAQVISDSANMSGRNCYLIKFELDAEGDSVDAEGDGEIWIDHQMLLPVRTFHDFTMNTKRGKAEVKTFTDFAFIGNGIPILLRSEIQTIPKFLFVKIGLIKIVIEQSDFSLE